VPGIFKIRHRSTCYPDFAGSFDPAHQGCLR
jgi:hypothetical protein